MCRARLGPIYSICKNLHIHLGENRRRNRSGLPVVFLRTVHDDCGPRLATCHRSRRHLDQDQFARRNFARRAQAEPLRALEAPFQTDRRPRGVQGVPGPQFQPGCGDLANPGRLSGLSQAAGRIGTGCGACDGCRPQYRRRHRRPLSLHRRSNRFGWFAESEREGQGPSPIRALPGRLHLRWRFVGRPRCLAGKQGQHPRRCLR